MEHTKGKFRIVNDRRIKKENNQIICDFFSFSEGISDKEAIANTKLTLDAFNTTNESGLTPSQLYKQNQELLDALEKSKDKISELFTKGVDSAKINSELFTILEQAINNAKTK